mmetsp:Transcript_4336/g.19551  ORF Transcript_4336/g.19551 Transcript_4336/m.19551 type:complete len:344 (-) Transcript_4336:973-2004(-)
MDTMTTTTKSSSRFWGKSAPPLPLVACPKMTNANSPPCDRNAPATSASRHVSPVSGPSAVIVASLPAMSPAVISVTMGNRSLASGTSIVVPMVTKKRLRNKPLNARSFWMMSCAYGVPASTRPAMNAPSESLNPAAAEAFENPKSTSSDSATKTSSSHSRSVMTSYAFLATSHPPTLRTPRSRKLVAVYAAMRPTSSGAPSPAICIFCSTGSAMMNGTTARSWKSRTPSDAVPSRVVIIPRSESSCSPSALDESVRPNPTTIASSGDRICSKSSTPFPLCTISSTWVPSASPGGRSAAANSRLPNTTWHRPSPNAYFPSAFSRCTDSSRPISNSRNWIPSSQN